MHDDTLIEIIPASAVWPMGVMRHYPLSYCLVDYIRKLYLRIILVEVYESPTYYNVGVANGPNHSQIIYQIYYRYNL